MQGRLALCLSHSGCVCDGTLRIQPLQISSPPAHSCVERLEPSQQQSRQHLAVSNRLQPASSFAALDCSMAHSLVSQGRRLQQSENTLQSTTSFLATTSAALSADSAGLVGDLTAAINAYLAPVTATVSATPVSSGATQAFQVSVVFPPNNQASLAWCVASCCGACWTGPRSSPTGVQVSATPAYTTQLAASFGSAAANQTSTVFASYIAKQGQLSISEVQTSTVPVSAPAATNLSPPAPIPVIDSGKFKRLPSCVRRRIGAVGGARRRSVPCRRGACVPCSAFQLVSPAGRDITASGEAAFTPPSPQLLSVKGCLSGLSAAGRTHTAESTAVTTCEPGGCSEMAIRIDRRLRASFMSLTRGANLCLSSSLAGTSHSCGATGAASYGHLQGQRRSAHPELHTNPAEQPSGGPLPADKSRRQRARTLALCTNKLPPTRHVVH